MRVLIWHSKHGDILFNASTKAKETAAMWAIFKLMDDACYYQDEEKERLAKARFGDPASIRAILNERDRCEHEEWEIIEVNDPNAETAPWDIDCTGFDDYQEAAHDAPSTRKIPVSRMQPSD